MSALCADPQLGTREGWRWCPDCAGIREPAHVHGDPLEAMSREQLLERVRYFEALRAWVDK